ncbi:MAG: histidine phosphatase family protein [Flavobacteriaceae bacterium]
MKKILSILIIVLCSFTTFAQEEVTTYYFIRHAEKVRTDKANRNPNLNADGLKRAKKWSQVFKNVKFDAVYSTNYNRTKQTAKPTADSKNLTIKMYNPRAMYDADFKANTKGKTVLIVGHSNTTPVFVNKILGNIKYGLIDDKNNANLYIVTITKGKVTDLLLKVD